MVRAILEAWSSLSQFSWSLRMYTMGMGLSRPSTMTPMFSTCPCTAMTMGTSSREVEHQMRYVECVKFWGHLGGHASLEPGATAIWRAGQMQATPDCHSRKCYPRLCWACLGPEFCSLFSENLYIISGSVQGKET